MPIGRFIGGVGALVRRPQDGHYLLLRRSAEKDFGAGVWECVTGRVDQGEGFIEALRREVREELGVEFLPEFFLGTSHFYRGAAQPGNELIGVAFCGTVADPAAVRLSAEHSELRWVTLAEAQALLQAQDPSTGWLLQVLQRAETIQVHWPQALREYFCQAGFELG